MTYRTLALPLILLAGCTTLGPVPGTTAISAAPAGRTSLEVSAGGVPGFYMSGATREDRKGAPVRQLAAVIEPAALGVPGLVVGARAVGVDDAVEGEPMLGYRRRFGAGGDVSGLAIVHGTRASADDNGASYEATRVGGELAVDYRVLGPQRWAEPHLFASVGATAVSAEGAYCVDARGFGVDCEEGAAPIAGEVEGVFPAATAGVALHGLANRDSWFHGARAAAMVGAGTMPRVISGEPEGKQAYLTFGVLVSLAVGSAR